MSKSILSFLMMNVIYVTSAQPHEFTSIVFIAKLCSWQQPQNKTKFETFYLQEFAKNLKGCSKGNVVFSKDASKNIVVNVDIPCVHKSATNDTLIVDNRLINKDNTYDYINEWMWYAIQKVNATHVVGNIDDYEHKLMIMPANDVIPWPALGNVGGPFSWYNTHDLNMNYYLHEIGHNFGFGHAMKNGEEYGDDTCIMGTGYRCYTAPHRHFLGWDYPLMTINWYNNSPSASYWNTTIHLSKDGEFTLINNNLYIESSQFSVNAYILQSNISTAHVCQIDTEVRSCNVDDYGISITFLDTNDDSNIIHIEPGFNSSLVSKQTVPALKNSASSKMLHIYDTVCTAFITYNIIVFLIAFW